MKQPHYETKLRETAAIKKQSSRRKKDGICLCHRFFTLKWKYCALIIRKAIKSAGIRTSDGYQVPALSNVANTILVYPTIVRIKSLSPSCFHSFTILSKQNIHTIPSENATMIWATLLSRFIFSMIYLLMNEEYIHTNFSCSRM